MNDNSKPSYGGEFDQIMIMIDEADTAFNALRLATKLRVAHDADLLATTEPLKQRIAELEAQLNPGKGDCFKKALDASSYEHVLSWDKPMTSKQAAKYLMTHHFVPVEFLRSRLSELDKAHAADRAADRAEIERLKSTVKNLKDQLFGHDPRQLDIVKLKADKAELLNTLSSIVDDLEDAGLPDTATDIEKIIAKHTKVNK